FVFAVSITYVTMAILGGAGYFLGPLVGGLTLTVLPELLRDAAEYKEFLNGLVLLLLLIFLPRGLIGFLSDRFAKSQAPADAVRFDKLPAARVERWAESGEKRRNVLLRVSNIS